MTSRCTKVVEHSLVKVVEKGRKATFKNPSKLKYEVSQVDGCLIDEGIRCDYLVSEIGTASVLIELKGSDVSHACDQLLRSACHSAVAPLLQKKIGFLIVCNRYPRFDTFVAKAKQKCAKLYKAGFHVVCDQRELDITKAVEIDGRL